VSARRPGAAVLRVAVLAALLGLAAGVPGLRAQEGGSAPDGGAAGAAGAQGGGAAGAKGDTAGGGAGSADETPGLSEQDIFGSDAFDQAVQQSKQEEQKNKLEYLVGGVFLFDSTLGTTIAFDGYSAQGSFQGKAFVRLSLPEYGSLYLGYLFDQTLYQGEAGSGSGSLAGADLYAPTFTLSEFHLSFDVAKVLFVRVGNQLIAWGPSLIWTPVDFINLQKVNPLAPADLRIGKPGVRLHVPLPRSNLFAFVDLSDTVTETAPGTYAVNDLFRATDYGLRGDLTALGFEFGLSAYLGPTIQNKYGFDFSGRLLGTDVYGELAMAFPYASYQFAYAWSLGFQRTLGELKKWTLSGEVYYNDALVTTPVFAPLYASRMYAYAALSKEDLIGTFLKGTLYGIGDVTDGSCLITLKGDFDIPRLFPFSVALGYSGGGAGKALTAYGGDNGLSAALDVRFEF
jgi:hypothetical protein